MQLTQLQRTANQREAGQSSSVELCRYRHFADATQLNSTSSWVELSCVAINGPLLTHLLLFFARAISKTAEPIFTKSSNSWAATEKLSFWFLTLSWIAWRFKKVTFVWIFCDVKHVPRFSATSETSWEISPNTPISNASYKITLY